MAKILNIDTSTSLSSVALSIDGEITIGLESSVKLDHSASLASFVEECINYLKERNLKLDAVSVTAGPGSYTGLRIGLSMAKGIAFGFGIPLITLSSLEVMAVRAIFTFPEFEGYEKIVPMIDARRMEVYTGVYNSKLKSLMPACAMILDENSFSEFNNEERIIFIGDGTEKFKKIKNHDNIIWLGSGMPHAKYMVTLSEKYYSEQKFADIAYAVPSYLKDYQPTTPKKEFKKW